MDSEDRPSFPPNLEEPRMQLFHISEPLTLRLSVFNDNWKYFDMYVPTANRKNKRGHSTYYSCRLWRKAVPSTVTPEKLKRNKTARLAVECPCRVRSRIDECSQTITFTCKAQPHNHDYSMLESKLTSGVKEIIAREVAKGYKAPYLAKALKNSSTGAWQMMKAAGGSAVTAKDILNVAQTYGREHPGGKADDAASERSDYASAAEILVSFGAEG